jgi:hypothetical protein
MTSRFPEPWRIVEIQVEDATGTQIGVFYGRAPDSAERTGIIAMDKARQVAIDFAKLPELLKQNATAGWMPALERDTVTPPEPARRALR